RGPPREAPPRQGARRRRVGARGRAPGPREVRRPRARDPRPRAARPRRRGAAPPPRGARARAARRPPRRRDARRSPRRQTRRLRRQERGPRGAPQARVRRPELGLRPVRRRGREPQGRRPLAGLVARRVEEGPALRALVALGALLLAAGCVPDEKPERDFDAPSAVREVFATRLLGDGTRVADAPVTSVTPAGIEW